jgi:ABC-type sugar transport system permease subunit
LSLVLSLALALVLARNSRASYGQHFDVFFKLAFLLPWSIYWY